TKNEQPLLQPLLDQVGNRVVDISGMMNLSQFLAFIQQSDGLLACSTGPLHLAAALGKAAIGLYPPERPVHPGRWAPLGKNAKVLVAAQGDRMDTIRPEAVKEVLDSQLKSLK